MAAAQIQIYSSRRDGTAIILHYDNVTLIATTLEFVVPNTLGSPMTVNARNAALNGGVPLTWQAPPSAPHGQYTFPTPIQGVVVVTSRGTGINFGFTQIQVGTVGNAPVPGNTVIHVTPNG
jgi:hypothetical protein